MKLNRISLKDIVLEVLEEGKSKNEMKKLHRIKKNKAKQKYTKPELEEMDIEELARIAKESGVSIVDVQDGEGVFEEPEVQAIDDILEAQDDE